VEQGDGRGAESAERLLAVSLGRRASLGRELGGGSAEVDELV
jgi:hypothetical protein